ncbi:glycosyltransferase [Afipia sp. P52-10]|uniref:CgeB family protein n=1 Tax=Afipia sp. P52-10 TaxID=1429916 RepID=UPI0003DF3BC5|nr:glycosyltransferase [Afipia sp. P52-10]ETR79254.1 glycosyltransferase [Afipia sp. P52-10]
MRFTIFGLTISSSWGNGHATLWRGLCKALAALGHSVTFYERDVPYYADTRDLDSLAKGELKLYRAWETIAAQARDDIENSDVAIVTSYCPDALHASDSILSQSRALRVFYDLDTPVTLAHLDADSEVPYIGPSGLSGFDLVLSYSGGHSLQLFKSRLGARRAAPLYGHVDPDLHRPSPPMPQFAADLSYLGTYAKDRQQTLEALFIEPAGCQPDRRFLIGGAQYPNDFPWTSNIYFVRHLPPAAHPAFFCSSRLTLNVTRKPMAESGWCPSGRLFEAAACGAPVVSDAWDGIDTFFAPGQDIIVARNTRDILAALELSDAELTAMARRARERTLAQHSSSVRARELVALVEQSPQRSDPLTMEA